MNREFDMNTNQITSCLNLSSRKILKNSTILNRETLEKILEINSKDFKNKKIVYCISDDATKYYIKKFNIVKSLTLNATMDLDSIINAVNDYDEMDDNSVLFVTDESIFNLLFVMKLVSMVNPICKLPKDLFKNKMLISDLTDFLHKIIVVRPESFNEFKTIVNKGGEKEEDFDKLYDVFKVVYSKFMEFLFLNLVMFINDQTVCECNKENNTSLDEFSANKIASVIKFWDCKSEEYSKYPKINFNEFTSENIDNLISSFNILISNFNKFLNKFLVCMLQLGQINFATVNRSNCIIKSKESSDLLLNPDTFANSKLISNIKSSLNYHGNDTSDISDLFYYMKYGCINDTYEFVVENLEFKSSSPEIVINNFKFPNGIYRDKQSLNVFTNIILDLCSKSEIL